MFLSVYACIVLVLLLITDIPGSPVEVAHEFISLTLDWSFIKLLGMSLCLTEMCLIDAPKGLFIPLITIFKGRYFFFLFGTKEKEAIL